MVREAVVLLLGAQVILINQMPPTKPMMKLMINVHGVVIITSLFSYAVIWVADEDISSSMTKLTSTMSSFPGILQLLASNMHRCSICFGTAFVSMSATFLVVCTFSILIKPLWTTSFKKCYLSCICF